MEKGKKYWIPMEPEFINYLQRLEFEMTGTTFILCRLFETHKEDKDLSLFEKKNFQNYMERFQKLHFEFEYVRALLTEEIRMGLLEEIKELKRETLNFQWKIEDFRDATLEVTIL